MVVQVVVEMVVGSYCSCMEQLIQVVVVVVVKMNYSGAGGSGVVILTYGYCRLFRNNNRKSNSIYMMVQINILIFNGSGSYTINIWHILQK
jgi:hypothetical protein